MDFTEVAPCVLIYDDAYDKCEELINRALRNRSDWTNASVGDNQVRDDIRHCESMKINSQMTGNVDDIVLAKTLFDHADHYGKHTRSSISDMEPLQLLHYKPSSDFYKPHCDEGEFYPRIFSSVLYLNDVDEGGETYFTHFDVAVQPKRGRLLMFPANYAYEHEARPPMSGEKFVVVTWFTPVMKWLQQ